MGHAGRRTARTKGAPLCFPLMGHGGNEQSADKEEPLTWAHTLGSSPLVAQSRARVTGHFSSIVWILSMACPQTSVTSLRLLPIDLCAPVWSMVRPVTRVASCRLYFLRANDSSTDEITLRSAALLVIPIVVVCRCSAQWQCRRWAHQLSITQSTTEAGKRGRVTPTKGKVKAQMCQ